MTNKAKLFYTAEHEWVEQINEDYVRVGITDYAVEQLGDIVFVELPDLSSEVESEGEFATVESVKSTSEIYSPVSGKVAKVNDALEDEPELMNESPLEKGWLVEIQSSEAVDLSGLMSVKAYEEYIETL